jgi:hypothetical protein
MLPLILLGTAYLISRTTKSVEEYHLGGDMSKHLAPNGKPSNLTHEQWHLVRTPEFKAWFGDWENNPKKASKVVDENGEPLVVYHSTEEKFNQFDYKTINDSANYYEIIGFYFTSNKPTKRNRYGNITKNCFLNIRNLIFVTDPITEKNPNWETKKLNKKEILLLIGDKKPVYNEYSKEKIIEILLYTDKLNSQLEFIYREFFSRWQVKDGIRLFLENLTDKLGFDGAYMPHSEYYVAFHPEQIKLADGTNTTFDGSNPDIRYVKGGLVYKKIYSKGGGGYTTSINGVEVSITRNYGDKTWIAQSTMGEVDVEYKSLADVKDYLESLDKDFKVKFEDGGIMPNPKNIKIGDYVQYEKWFYTPIYEIRGTVLEFKKEDFLDINMRPVWKVKILIDKKIDYKKDKLVPHQKTTMVLLQKVTKINKDGSIILGQYSIKEDGGESDTITIDDKESTIDELYELLRDENYSVSTFNLNPKKIEYNGNNEQIIREIKDYNRQTNPYYKGELQEHYMIAMVQDAFSKVSFRKFGDAYRKNIDKGFKAERYAKNFRRGYTFQEHASYIIGDGSFYVNEDEFRSFAKDLGIPIPPNISK